LARGSNPLKPAFLEGFLHSIFTPLYTAVADG